MIVSMSYHVCYLCFDARVTKESLHRRNFSLFLRLREFALRSLKHCFRWDWAQGRKRAMPPHSPNMYRDPYNTAAAASPLSAPRQLVASPPSRLRNVNNPAAVPASPNFSAAHGSPAAWTAQSSRFQAAAPASPGVRNLASDTADSQYNYNGSPHMRSAPVIPQTLHLAQNSPQVGNAVSLFQCCVDPNSFRCSGSVSVWRMRIRIQEHAWKFKN
jgi:hypothetical protein